MKNIKEIKIKLDHMERSILNEKDRKIINKYASNQMDKILEELNKGALKTPMSKKDLTFAVTVLKKYLRYFTKTCIRMVESSLLHKKDEFDWTTESICAASPTICSISIDSKKYPKLCIWLGGKMMQLQFDVIKEVTNLIATKPKYKNKSVWDAPKKEEYKS